MAKYVVIAVRDSAAEVFAQPMFVPAVGVAVRSFQTEVNRVAENNMINLHPEHFSMYELGSYDDVSGSLIPVESPRQVARAVDLFNKS